ncbi:MAG: mannose-6-phosphate isomerase [Clostridiales bacterium]|nr:mannose-6-phosphate isomerase [Clostridiales bacterium]
MKRPIKLKPVYKSAIWGGSALRELYGVDEPLPELAEAWQLTVREDGMNIMQSGAGAGQPLDSLEGVNIEDFPLLVKFIDAGAPLSIQVHPAKTEMWYIVDAKPGARLVYGTKPGMTEEKLRAALEAGTLEDCMNYVEVKKGETYFIPTGLTHAIGGGILIAEIQENSNVTYRVYDYNRRGSDGKLRRLHTDEAFPVMRSFTDKEIKSLRYSRPAYVPAGGELLAACDIFTSIRYSTAGGITLPALENFAHVLVIGGQGRVGGIPVKGGDSIYVPAGSGSFPVEGVLEIIVSVCPKNG